MTTTTLSLDTVSLAALPAFPKGRFIASHAQVYHLITQIVKIAARIEVPFQLQLAVSATSNAVPLLPHLHQAGIRTAIYGVPNAPLPEDTQFTMRALPPGTPLSREWFAIVYCDAWQIMLHALPTEKGYFACVLTQRGEVITEALRALGASAKLTGRASMMSYTRNAATIQMLWQLAEMTPDAPQMIPGLDTLAVPFGLMTVLIQRAAERWSFAVHALQRLTQSSHVTLYRLDARTNALHPVESSVSVSALPMHADRLVNRAAMGEKALHGQEDGSALSVVPLSSGARNWGVLEFARPTPFRPAEQAQIELLGALVSYAAHVLDPELAAGSSGAVQPLVIGHQRIAAGSPMPAQTEVAPNAALPRVVGIRLAGAVPMVATSSPLTAPAEIRLLPRSAEGVTISAPLLQIAPKADTAHFQEFSLPDGSVAVGNDDVYWPDLDDFLRADNTVDTLTVQTMRDTHDLAANRSVLALAQTAPFEQPSRTHYTEDGLDVGGRLDVQDKFDDHEGFAAALLHAPVWPESAAPMALELPQPADSLALLMGESTPPEWDSEAENASSVSELSIAADLAPSAILVPEAPLGLDVIDPFLVTSLPADDASDKPAWDTVQSLSTQPLSTAVFELQPLSHIEPNAASDVESRIENTFDSDLPRFDTEIRPVSIPLYTAAALEPIGSEPPTIAESLQAVSHTVPQTVAQVASHTAPAPTHPARVPVSPMLNDMRLFLGRVRERMSRLPQSKNTLSTTQIHLVAQVVSDVNDAINVLGDMALVANLNEQPSIMLHRLDLCVLMQSLYGDLKAHAARRGVRLTWKIDEHSVYIRGNEDLLSQGIRALIGGLLELTPTARVVQVRLTRSEDSIYLNVSVPRTDALPKQTEALQAGFDQLNPKRNRFSVANAIIQHHAGVLAIAPGIEPNTLDFLATLPVSER